MFLDIFRTRSVNKSGFAGVTDAQVLLHVWEPGEREQV